MSRILRPWTSQPQSPARISAQYLDGLALFHTPGFELANNALLSTNIPGTIAAPAGRAYSTSGAAGRASTNARLVTSSGTGTGTGDFTIIVHAAPVSSSTRQIPYAITNPLGQAPESFIVFNSAANLVATPGSWTFTSIAGIPGQTVSGVDGRLHAFGVRRRGNEVSVWWDGVQLSSLTSTAGIKPNNNDFDYIGGYKDSGYGHVDPLYQVAGWNRAFTDEEMRAAADMQWAWEPRSIWAPVTAGGGGGVVDLITAAAAHPHSADSLQLSTDSALAADGASHAHAAESLTLTLAGTEALVTQDAAHSHGADSPTLTSSTALTAADASHGHGADSLTLTVAGQTLLAVDDTAHAQAADSLTLTTQTGLAVADAAHGHTADSLAIEFSGSTALGVDDAQHSHQADALALFFSTATAADAAKGRGKRRRLYLGPEQRDDEQPPAPVTQAVPEPVAPAPAPAAASEPAPPAVRLADALPKPAPRATAPAVDPQALAAVQSALAAQEDAMAQAEAAALEQRRRRIEAHNRAAMAAAELLLMA